MRQLQALRAASRQDRPPGRLCRSGPPTGERPARCAPQPWGTRFMWAVVLWTLHSFSIPTLPSMHRQLMPLCPYLSTALAHALLTPPTSLMDAKYCAS